MNTVQKFLKDESAAITVEFVIMGAAITAISIAVLLLISDGLNFRSTTDSTLIADTDRNATAIELMEDAAADEQAQN